MNSVIDLRTYVSASNSRLLVMADLQEKNYDELADGQSFDLARSLENCMSAIQHARKLGLPIAFTRRTDSPGSIGRSAQSAWISGFEPKRSDMVFERPQPSCYTNQLFDDVVSQAGSFAIAGLVAEQTCLATAIDASHRGHDADARAVHVVTTKAIELFADTVTTRDWLVATPPRTPKGHRHG